MPWAVALKGTLRCRRPEGLVRECVQWNLVLRQAVVDFSTLALNDQTIGESMWVLRYWDCEAASRKVEIMSVYLPV